MTLSFFPFFFQEPRRRHICLVSSIIELLVQIKYILNVLITRGVLGMLDIFLTCPSFFWSHGIAHYGVRCTMLLLTPVRLNSGYKLCMSH